jgi:hypothetical protein
MSGPEVRVRPTNLKFQEGLSFEVQNDLEHRRENAPKEVGLR